LVTLIPLPFQQKMTHLMVLALIEWNLIQAILQ